MNMKNIDTEVDDEDKALLLLCSLPNFFDKFNNLMSFNRDTISLVDVKSILNSIELKTRSNEKGSDDQPKDLFVKGPSKKPSNSRVRFNERYSGKGKRK
jgi:hypothetical protein